MRAIVLMLLLSACAQAPAPATLPLLPAAAVGVAPMPKQYTCAQTSRAAAEYKALPHGSMLTVFLDDYGMERRALRAYHKLPLDGKCV